jgi:hypothetical protein
VKGVDSKSGRGIFFLFFLCLGLFLFRLLLFAAFV